MNKQTNVEFVTEVMEYSKYGPLMQAFVIDCMLKWSSHIITNETEVLLQMKNGLVHAESWIGCAKELKQKIEDR